MTTTTPTEGGLSVVKTKEIGSPLMGTKLVSQHDVILSVSVKRRLQTADCRLQTRGKMQTEGKMQTAYNNNNNNNNNNN